MRHSRHIALLSPFAVSFLLLLSMLFLSQPAAAQDDLCQAVVYSARMKDGTTLTTEDLIDLAKTRGTIEVIQFDCELGPDEPVSRRLVRLGEPGIGFPGFSSRSRLLYKNAITAGIVPEDKGQTWMRTFQGAPGKKIIWDVFKDVASLEGIVVFDVRVEVIEKERQKRIFVSRYVFHVM